MQKIFRSNIIGLKNYKINKFFCSKREDQQPPFTEIERTFLEPSEFFQELKNREIDFFTGVPDSLLKDICAYISDNTSGKDHLIAANEGTAMGIAAGYHLATNKYPLVYLQNSGLGNIVNPLMSLCHQKVYKIPMLLLIGWRGEPGKYDEPQHLVQGKSMNGMMAEMGLQFEILPDYMDGAKEVLDSAIHHMQTRSSPYALIVKRQVFSPYKLKKPVDNNYSMNREDALKVVLKQLGPHDITVGTTGFLSRELEELRRKNKHQYSEDNWDADQVQRDFLTVGSMGHSSSIALGISLFKPSRKVFCLDGDGAMFMHMGSLPQNAAYAQSNFYHILFNNSAHDSVGAQPTFADKVNLPGLAQSSGYKTFQTADSQEQLENAIKGIYNQPGPHFLEVKIRPGARKDLSRPKLQPYQTKEKFMKYLRQ